jgi:glutamyl-tRNA reductase
MIGVVGLSHKTADLAVRERLIIQEAEQTLFIKSLRECLPSLEIVMLATCNRLEIYFHAEKECFPNIFALLVEKLLYIRNIDYESVRNYIYTLQNEKAIKHLFQVTAGLDSLVLGENEILGQVKTSYAWSVRQGYTAAVFNRLFHKAFEIGKRVRTETSINQRASSVSSVAIELCQQKLEQQSSTGLPPEKLQELPILLLGAGSNGERLIKNLVQKGCRCITVMSRQFEHAQLLASHFNAHAEPIERLAEVISRQRLIITSTAAPVPLISRAQVHAILNNNSAQSFIFIDLSVPRDIEEEVRFLPRVTLFDLDDLKRIINKNQGERKEELDKAMEIIGTGVKEFNLWLGEQSLKPTVRLLQARINIITSASLEAFKKDKTFINGRVGHEQESSAMLLSALAARIEKKYLGLLIKNLKTISENGKKVEYIKLVNMLFDLDGIGNKHRNHDGKGYMQLELRNN